MKKILFLLLLSVAMYGQVPADATPLENIQITNNQTSTTATKVNVQEADGTINTISKSDLVNVVDVNDVHSLPLVGEVGKIYVVKNLNKIYRWNGTFYQELASSDLNYQSIIDALTFTPENVANKSTELTASSTLYPTNNAVIVALATKEDKVNKVTSIGSSANDTNYPSELAVKTYADNLVVGMLNDRGTWDASGNVFPTTGGSGVGGAIRKGDMWYISVAGTLGTKLVNVGDSFRALVNAPAQVAGNWSILEANIGYVPANDSNVVHLTGAETITGVKTFSPSISAVTGSAKGTIINPTLTATANNDVLVGLDVAPTFNNGAFTGVNNWGARIRNFYATGNRNLFRPIDMNTSPNVHVIATNSYSLQNYTLLTLGMDSGGKDFNKVTKMLTRMSTNSPSTDAKFYFSLGSYNSYIDNIDKLNPPTDIIDIVEVARTGIAVTGTVSSGTTALNNTPPTANNQLTRKDYVDTGLNSKEPSFTKNTAFNKNFGTTAGTVVEGNYPPAKDGTGATGTWGINISGNAASATSWGAYNGSNVVNNLVYGMGYDSGSNKWTYVTLPQFRSWLDLGSNAYSSTPYLPLSGGTLTGALNGTSGNFSSGISARILNNSSGDILNMGGQWTLGANIDSRFYIYNANTLSEDFQLSQATGAATFASSVTATSFFQSSDRRLKTILKRDGDVAYFKWKDGRDDKVHIGVIAQEVRKTHPDQVQADDKGILSVNYVEILVEKIRVLEKRIEQLEKSK